MTASELTELAARVEVGSGEDWRLDRDVCRSLLIHHWIDMDGQDQYGGKSELLTSLDAVVALVEEWLPGWTWNIERVWTPSDGYFWIADADPPEAGPSPEQASHEEECRARLIMALRALAAQQQDRQTEGE